ncbi:MAG: class I SAM-dependent methyltransferase [Thermoplasmata archaeon]|nr:class I SAM-dependent methyltransferase [Thermoplasmata archaeon]
MNDLRQTDPGPPMTNAEAILYRVLMRSGFHRPLVALLRSRVAWRLSGLSLPTALFATTGSWGTEQAYVRTMRLRWDRFDRFVPPGSRVLDFGTGLGGNLLGLGERVASGVGVDINPFYVGHARRIARRAGATRLAFLAYDGVQLPSLGQFDLAISTGAFERIPKDPAAGYVHQLAGVLRPGGRLILYFLTPAARESGFGRLLGPAAYVFWEEGELRAIFHAEGLEVAHVERGFPTAGDTYVLRAPE